MTQKDDNERVGLFIEGPYVNIGCPYLSKPTQVRQDFRKGRQIIPEGNKSVSANSDGYFNEFTRVFEGESGRPNKRKGRSLPGKRQLLAGPIHKPSGIGSYFGGISEEPLPYFSGIKRNKDKYRPQKKNFITNPGKKGSGYGYNDITINTYPEYFSSVGASIKDILFAPNKLHSNIFNQHVQTNDYFDPNPYTDDNPKTFKNKNPGEPVKSPQAWIPSNYGRKFAANTAGGLSTYPNAFGEWVAPVTNFNRAVHVVNDKGKTFIPNIHYKSIRHPSTVYQNIKHRHNKLNYDQFLANYQPMF